MKFVPFILLTLLTLVYVGLTLAETMTYHKWEQAVFEQKVIQDKVAFYHRMNTVLDQLIRRMAYDSQHDPALVHLLADHRIKVVFGGPKPSNYGTVPDASTNSAPTSVDIPAPTSNATPVTAPANSTPSHP
jgi:hypothetical protein